MNIILLVCDALRATSLGCYGSEKGLSPQIDTIAKNGMRFTNTFATTNATDSSFTTIFTARYPMSHGILNHASKITSKERSYTTSLTLLAEILRNNGLTTIGIDWLGKWHKRGFDHYGNIAEHVHGCAKVHFSEKAEKLNSEKHKSRSSKHRRSRRRGLFPKISSPLSHYNWYYFLPKSARKRLREFYYSAETKRKSGPSKMIKSPIFSDSAALTDLAIEYIRKSANKQNFFLFVHYWDNHIPYTAPKSLVKRCLHNFTYPQTKIDSLLDEWQGTTTGHIIERAIRGKSSGTIAKTLAYYDSSVIYVDSHIGRIYQCISENDILEDTLFIITSDHGESLLEHGIFFDHHGLYDQQLRVPLIISNPGTFPGTVYDEFVQHFDILPTILDFLGCDSDLCFDGESLLNLAKGKSWDRKFVYAEEANAQRKRMIRDKDYKYIAALNDQPCSYCKKYHFRGDEFYDLQKDPQEKNNIIDNVKSLRYKEKLDAYIRSLRKPIVGEHVSFEDERKINEKLKALGYL